MIKLPRNDGLNIVPFIDIMLVLLAIVLSISTFVAYGHIKIEPPKSESARNVGDNDNKLLISIDEKDLFYLDDKEASTEELEEKIANLDEKTLVELKADKNCKFESFIQVISMLKSKEHNNFQIITQR
ncbi:TonB system transport protein ExbD [Campylobacter troglodytis]|uniref:TonB system transport protein ExbD n=1 Tax=Campylobacter troglodytis TaxID=654363 RepID=UPI00115B495B|nr:TonB system transport protein ExbD [Campylobacter troglodytis]TQR53099.1 TonB system transport protein ExbD [Campylobacter troglodytis]